MLQLDSLNNYPEQIDSNITNYILTIGTLLLGWVLGILSNLLNEKLKRRSSKKDIKSGIKTELSELQILLSSICLKTSCLINQFDKDFFLWIKPYFIKAFKSTEFIFPKEILEAMPKITEIDDEILMPLIIAAYTSDDPRLTFNYSKITTPYIDIKISDLSLLDVNIQKNIFTLKRDINHLNEDFEQVWFYHSQTFSNTSDRNQEILRMNISQLYSKIFRKLKPMINITDDVLRNI